MLGPLDQETLGNGGEAGGSANMGAKWSRSTKQADIGARRLSHTTRATSDKDTNKGMRALKNLD